MTANAGLVFAAALVLSAGSAAWAQPAAAPRSGPAQPPDLSQTQDRLEPAASAAGCEASSLAWLVGKPRSAIPVPVNPSLRRVYCSTCLVTQDYIPGRTDIIFDTETGIITAVKCG